MNWIFLGLISISVLAAAFNGSMPQLTQASISSAKSAVELAISLVGQMTLWLGLLGVIRDSGLMAVLARGLRPVMTRLFPDVPADHPAMGAMIMNLSANMLGLGNAATPFGLKAMAELDSLNEKKGVASNSMALFLAINTTGVAVLPISAVAIRGALGSKDPAGIIVPTLLTTICATVVAVAVAKFLERRGPFRIERFSALPVDAPKTVPVAVVPLPAGGVPSWKMGLALALIGGVLFGLVRSVSTAEPGGFELVRSLLSSWLLPLLIFAIVAIGFGRGVKVYESFIAAAKEGFPTAISVIPFLVGMLVAIGMFRASGALDAVVDALRPLTSLIGFPAEALPMALIRPLSGSGATAVMSDAMKTYGTDSFIGYLVSVINGGTETTFYVLALYTGSVQVRVLRHALPACIAADFAGPVAAFFVCKLFWGALA